MECWDRLPLSLVIPCPKRPAGMYNQVIHSHPVLSRDIIALFDLNSLAGRHRWPTTRIHPVYGQVVELAGDCNYRPWDDPEIDD